MNKLLHTPLTVHNVELANRLVMPPMATGKTPDGTVQDDLLAYYDARSKGGCIGLIVTEHAYVSPEGKAHEGQLSVSRDTDIPGLTKLVETIHKNNTRVIAQINHAGSAAMEEITGYPAISASVTAQPEYARKSEKPVREMTAEITWSSPNYDYMIVDGEKYLPVNTEGNSVFEIPVAALDTALAVTADTTAMSTPHEIEYTLTFDSASLTA